MNRILKMFFRKMGLCASANGTDYRTGTGYSDSNMARQRQRREDREIRTDMRAVELGLTARRDRVRELTILTRESCENHRLRNTPGCTDSHYRRYVARAIGRDVRALGVAG